MQCPCPITVKDPNTGKYREVPCGKCYNCMMTRRQEWVFRLRHEVYNDTEKAFFVTLTYDDQHLDLNRESFLPEVSVRTCQLFLKSLRKLVPNFRYFMISEYGPRFTIRPHYHLVLMFPKNDQTNYFDNKGNLKPYPLCKDVSLLTYKTIQTYIERAWQRGFIQVAPVTPARIAYVTKYCLKYQQVDDDRRQGFSLMSRRPGIGSSFLTPAKTHFYALKTYEHDALLVQGEDGSSISLPRFYRNKIPAASLIKEVNENLATVRKSQKLQRIYHNGGSSFDPYKLMKIRERHYIQNLKK